jgi:phosphatidylcholine synthase
MRGWVKKLTRQSIAASGSKLGAFGVHVLTASGAACALAALLAAVEAKWAAMFAWLGVALLVDAVDGPLARVLQVAQRLPRWSGETLDLVVDFTTYVFVPAYAIAASRLLPEGLEAAGAAIVAVTGALYFADRRMKTPDNYFRGFPGLWNLAAFYLLLLRPQPYVAAALVAALAVATFAPFPFIHPLRVARLRFLNLAVLALWAVLAVIAIAQDLTPPPWVTGGLLALGAYVCCAGIFRQMPAR